MRTTGLNIKEAVQMTIDTGCKVRQAAWDPRRYIYLEEGSGEFLWDDRETFVPTCDSLCADDWEIVREIPSTMPFTEAVEAMKKKKIVRRRSWRSTLRMEISGGNFYKWDYGDTAPRVIAEVSYDEYQATDWVETMNWIGITDDESKLPEYLHEIKCDRCGKMADFENGGGNCGECGDDLCLDCAGSWTELAKDDEPGHAVCAQCAREKWRKDNEPKLDILHKIQKEINDYLGYLGSTGNECAWTDRTIEAIIEQAKLLEIIHNECIARL
jgi:hypothetical protein